MPTRSFLKEHLLIEQVLNCLETMLERCASQKTLELSAARDVVVFLRDSIERCYRIKEDTQLRPVMESLGVSAEHCLGCSMRRRGEKGRLHVAAMEQAIESASDGDPVALREFTEHGRAYIALLLDYMADEEDCLFPMISETLSKVDNAGVLAALTSVFANGDKESACNSYVDLANRLADHFDVPRAVTAHSNGNYTATDNIGTNGEA